MFSELENQVLKAIGRKKRISISDIAKKIENSKSLDVRNLVCTTISRINKKCAYHRLDWFINGYGLGRGGRTVWKDKVPQ
jgi:hypothetical protein